MEKVRKGQEFDVLGNAMKCLQVAPQESHPTKEESLLTTIADCVKDIRTRQKHLISLVKDVCDATDNLTAFCEMTFLEDLCDEDHVKAFFKDILGEKDCEVKKLKRREA